MTPDDQGRDLTLTPTPALALCIAGHATTSVQSYLSTHYLWAARFFTSKANEIEQQGVSVEPKIFREHSSYVTGAIFSAVAFLEAAVNEFFKGVAEEQNSCYVASIAKETQRAISMLWELTEDRNRSTFGILDKYQLILTLCGKTAFDTGVNPYQDVDLIIKLRNELTHYKPETYVLGGKQHRFSKQFAGKFVENRLMPDGESAYFPDRCLGSGCDEWVVQGVTNLADEFFKRLGVSPHYQLLPF